MSTPAAALPTGLAPAAPAAKPPARHRLWLVPPAVSHAPRAPFIVLVTAILFAGLVALLLLNTSLQRGAFVLSDLERETTALRDRQADLAQETADLAAPQRIAAKAAELGMVANTSPSYLRVADGTVLHVPEPRPPTQRR